MKVRIKSCTRCHKSHDELEFHEFNTPVYEGDSLIWTHWAMCPDNYEPILLLVEEK
jgi:hypothetical protein